MNILIIGCGKVGSKLAVDFWNEGHDVSIVDSDSGLFNNLPSDFNGLTVAGVPIDADVLKKAGIEEADAVAAVTPDDNINIMVCQVAKVKFKKENIIARIYDPERKEVFNHFGLETICPTNMTVDSIKTRLCNKVESNYQIIKGGFFGFKEILVSEEAVGRPISEIELDSGYMFFCVKRHSEIIMANQLIKLQSGDIAVLVQKID